MGAWGIKTFENDDASDWVCELEDASGTSVIENAFEFEDDYIESPEGSEALAAAEVLLALKGKARDNLPEEVTNWVKSNKELDVTKLIPKAIDSVKKILSEDSELNELWEESDDFDSWVKDVTELVTALENS
jgi:hypothetical protein